MNPIGTLKPFETGGCYLIAFGKPAGHREVAPREFDVHSRWSSRESRREKKEKKNKKSKKNKKNKMEDEDKAVIWKRLV